MQPVFSRVTLALLLMSPYNPTLGDALFSAQNQTLYVPFLHYQGQNYQAEFSLLNSRQLQLKSAIPRSDHPVYGAHTTVNTALDFTVQRINFTGQLYDADISYQQGDIFTINELVPSDESHPERGKVNTATLVNSISREQFDLLVSLFNAQQSTGFAIRAKNAIQVYRISYQTIDPAGMITNASALVAFPDNIDNSYPLIAYQHGTEVLRTAAPSQDPLDIATLGFAASGYVVVSTDYLGLGDSELLHPFLHAHSLATAVIDALRATKQLTTEHNISLNNQLFLMGYSEGGYATMAVHRELQQNYSDEFTVTASAPLAGSYDLVMSLQDQLATATPLAIPYYLPYALLAANQIYGYSEQLSDIFQMPYAQTITDLYDGLHSHSAINAFLPEKQELYSAKFQAQLADSQNSLFMTILAENNTYQGWAPSTPMYLLHCINDNQVPFSNSQLAYAYFQSVGATQVQLITVDDLKLNQGDVHTNCALPLLVNGLTLFEPLLQ
jgi:predicted esterase